MNSLMEKNNQLFVNEKETDLLVQKIELEWDFHSSRSDCASLQRLSSPRSVKEGPLRRKPKKKKKKKKAHFARPIESDQVKREILSSFDLDFERQVDKDIFVQYGEFSDYISLFNQKFNKPEKKICKFSLERLSKSMKKLLVFGKGLAPRDRGPEARVKGTVLLTTGDVALVSRDRAGGIQSMNLDSGGVRPGAWKALKKSVSATPAELKKIPPGLSRFVAGKGTSPFKERKLDPYRTFLLRPEEPRPESSEEVLPNLEKSRAQATKANTEELVQIISRKKDSTRILSMQTSGTLSLARNSFLTKGVSSDASIKKITSQSTMNQTRVTEKSSSQNLRSNKYSSFDKRASLEDEEEEEKFDIYDREMPKSQIDKILGKFIQRRRPAKKDRFSEVINNRCSLNAHYPGHARPQEEPSQEELEAFQIKVTGVGSKSSNLEPKPKRSIFSHMNGLSKQEFYSINEEDHIKEEEEEASSHSASLRESLKNRISKSSSNRNSFLDALPQENQTPAPQEGLVPIQEIPRLAKVKSLGKQPDSKCGSLVKSGKKLKLKKKVREYVPNKQKKNLLEGKKNAPKPGSLQMPLQNNQTLNPHNYPEYGKTSHLMPPGPKPQNSLAAPVPGFGSQRYLGVPQQFGHYPVNPVRMAPMRGFSQGHQMPMYPPSGPMYMPQMYPNYPGYPVQNMQAPNGYLGGPMYLQPQPVFYNMPGGYMPRAPMSSSGNSGRMQEASPGEATPEAQAQEINSFAK